MLKPYSYSDRYWIMQQVPSEQLHFNHCKDFFCKDTPIDDLFQKIGITPISSNGKVFSPPDKFPGRQNLGGDQ